MHAYMNVQVSACKQTCMNLNVCMHKHPYTYNRCFLIVLFLVAVVVVDILVVVVVIKVYVDMELFGGLFHTVCTVLYGSISVTNTHSAVVNIDMELVVALGYC